MKNSKKINFCRISKTMDLTPVFKIKSLGLTGTFPKKKSHKIVKTPFEVVFSNKSKLLQLNHNYDPKILYGKNYGYRSGLNPVMINHLKEKSRIIKKKYNLKDENILDIGANDGTFISFFNKSHRFAVDPTITKFKKFYSKNVYKIPKRFEESIDGLKNKKFKLITCLAMFYDLEDPVFFLLQAKKILSRDGIIHVEVAYLPEIIKTFSYDTFCQEHYEYYSFHSLNYLFLKCKLKIINFGFNKINGGSIWIEASHQENNLNIKTQKNLKLLQNEKKKKIDKLITYKKFFFKVKKHSASIRKILVELKKQKRIIYGFGASTKGNVLLQFGKINGSLIDGIFDINSEKFKSYTPITKIKIIDENKMKDFQIEYILLLIWHFDKYVIQKIKKINKKIKIIIPFPKIKII